MPQLLDLPLELQDAVTSYLDFKSLSRTVFTSKSSQSMYDFWFRRAGDELLSSIVLGEKEKVVRVLKTNPRLLCARMNGEVKDFYFSRIYLGYTPLQVALLCYDEELWKEIKSLFHRVDNGMLLMAEQVVALFPEGFFQQQSFNFTPIRDTITNVVNDDLELLMSLAMFRRNFEAQAQQEICFNPNHLLKAFQMFHDCFDNWSLQQRQTFWCGVIGYTQRFVPRCLLFALGNDFYQRVRQTAGNIQSPLKRQMPASFFRKQQGLGFNYAFNAHIDSYQETADMATAITSLENYQAYVNQMKQKYVALINQSHEIVQMAAEDRSMVFN